MSPGKGRFFDKRFDVQKKENIDVNALETLPFDYPQGNTTVTIGTKEFTSVCPWSGLPDTAELLITYIPDKKLVEMKSLKYYLLSFRNVGILQEHAANRILKDLSALLKPKLMEIEARFESRGGLNTIVRASYSARKARLPRSKRRSL